MYSDNDRKLIRSAYRDLLETMTVHQVKLDGSDKKDIKEAFRFAVAAHSNQRRKSGEPYILHPIEVASICIREIGLGTTAIISALLHDVIEDTPISLEEITVAFGPKIAMIVDGLTKLDGTYKSLSPQAENFKKILSTLIKDVRVVLIKIADRLHNLRTIQSLPQNKKLKIASETKFIYAPLAYRLGVYNIKTEFEDLCLQITDPDTYYEIKTKLKSSKEDRDEFIAEFIQPLDKSLKELGIKTRIYGRSKSIASIDNKIKTKEVAFEEVYDLFAIRIVVDVAMEEEKTTCWKVYSIITDNYRPVTERLRDWISVPKSNGYESLHTTILSSKGKYVEVQIRSERMEEIAERGYAAHWKYKGMLTSSNVFEDWLDGIKDMLENNEGDAIEFVNDFKTNLFNEEVYVYTPKGDLKILPKGASALDFAFSIHSDLGYHCIAIKVNNKLVPFGYQLQNGDQVSVATSRSQKPTDDWLKMVVTGKARSKIRSAMKEAKRKQGEFGRESLERKLRNMKVSFEENADMLVKFFGFKNRPDLYFAIAIEEVNLQEIKDNFTTDGNKLVVIEEEVEVPEIIADPEIKRPRKYEGKPRLMINGSKDEYQYTLASCCNPLQGDDVFGYLTASAGLKIHRNTCPNATHLMANYGYRIMKAEWIEAGNTSFVAQLRITGVDDGPGVIERLSHSISTDLGLNIRSFFIEGHEGYFEGKVHLLVANKNQLNIAIRGLQNLEGVSSVSRLGT